MNHPQPINCNVCDGWYYHGLPGGKTCPNDPSVSSSSRDTETREGDLPTADDVLGILADDRLTALAGDTSGSLPGFLAGTEERLSTPRRPDDPTVLAARVSEGQGKTPAKLSARDVTASSAVSWTDAKAKRQHAAALDAVDRVKAALASGNRFRRDDVVLAFTELESLRAELSVLRTQADTYRQA